MNAVVQPMTGDSECLGDLRHDQMARNPPGVGLMLLPEVTAAQANGSYRAGQDARPHWGTKAFGGELVGDGGIRITFGKKGHQALGHIVSARVFGERSHGDGAFQGADFPALPDEAYLEPVARLAMSDHPVDEAPQKSFLVLAFQEASLPGFGPDAVK